MLWKEMVLIYLGWGLNWVVMKLAAGCFPPAFYVSVRFGLGGAVLLLFGMLNHYPQPERKCWPWIVAAGILQVTLCNLAVQISIKTLGAGMVSVLNYSMPLWVSLLAYFFLGESLSFRKIGGILLSFAGLAVLMGVSASGDLSAVLLGLLSGVLWAGANIIYKLKMTGQNMLTVTGWQMSSGAVLLFLYYLLTPQEPVIWNFTAVWTLLFGIFIPSAYIQYLWNIVLRHAEAGKASTALLAVPAVSVAGGIIFLGEIPTLQTLIGMIMIMAGIVIVETE
jgi:O-acetylserine/cysteine efflux transporter